MKSGSEISHGAKGEMSFSYKRDWRVEATTGQRTRLRRLIPPTYFE